MSEFGHEIVRFSRLKAMATSPLAYKHAVEEGRKDTDDFIMGRYGHAAILEPETVPGRFAIWPDEEGQRRGNGWENFKALNTSAGKSIIREKDQAEVHKWVAAFHQNEYAMSLITGVDDQRYEFEIDWVDEATGLRCGSRLDCLVTNFQRILVDLKSATDVSPWGFSRAVHRLSYHGQLAFYRRGLVANDLAPDDCYIIAYEKKPPYDVVPYHVPESVLEQGDRLVDRLLAQVARCRAVGFWPGHADGNYLELDLPHYAWEE